MIDNFNSECYTIIMSKYYKLTTHNQGTGSMEDTLLIPTGFNVATDTRLFVSVFLDLSLNLVEKFDMRTTPVQGMISTLICWFDYQNQDFQSCFLKYHWFVIIKLGNLRETVWLSKDLIIKPWKSWLSLIIELFTTSLPSFSILPTIHRTKDLTE